MGFNGFIFRIHVAKLDVSDWEQVNNVVNSLPEGFSDIDILVNNAGLAKGVRFTVDNIPVRYIFSFFR